ncbi:MAG: right-handed parallel beta-helix repeat-containing protein, partial [Thermoplasmata archaeon]|nr:right-handed parallel beta-helix repeat-containing protein [Thermoplasmata archaeon]
MRGLLPVLSVSLVLLLPGGFGTTGPSQTPTPPAHSSSPRPHSPCTAPPAPPSAPVEVPPVGSHGSFRAPPTAAPSAFRPGPRIPNPGCGLSSKSFGVTIRADGSLSNLTAPVHRVGNTYTFTGNYSGGLLDERNGSTVDGQGYRLDGSGLPTALEIANVSGSRVSNLTVGGSTDLVVVWLSSGVTVSALRELAGPQTHVGFCAELSSSVLLLSDTLAENTSNNGVGDGASTFAGDSGVTITNCTFYGTYDLLAASLRGATLSGNTFTGPGTAIWLASTTNFDERNDRFVNSTLGIAVVSVNGSRGLTWVGNQFTQPPNLGLWIESSRDIRLDGNHFSGFAGGAIFVVFDQNVSLSANQFLLGGNGSIAINIDSVGGATLVNNTA